MTQYQIGCAYIDGMTTAQIEQILANPDLTLTIEWEVMGPLDLGSITSHRGMILADRLENHMRRRLQARRSTTDEA